MLKTMKKFLGLLLTLAVIQCGVSEVRDHRHFRMKLDTVNEYVDKTLNELPKLHDSDNEIVNALHDFTEDTKSSINFIKIATKDNARNNAPGKRLQETYNLARQCEDLLQSSVGKDRSNLKRVLESCLKIVKSVADVFPDVKEAAENPERAINSLLDFIDNSLYSIKKVFYHLVFRKFTNLELRNNINKVMEEDLVALQGITPGSYRVNELVIHGHQLGYFVNKLVDRLSYWVDNAKDKDFELSATVENVIAQLREVSAATTRHSTPKSSLENLIVMYKIWLRHIAHNVANLDLVPKNNANGIVRDALYDAVGIMMNFKTIFPNLAGSRN